MKRTLFHSLPIKGLFVTSPKQETSEKATFTFASSRINKKLLLGRFMTVIQRLSLFGIRSVAQTGRRGPRAIICPHPGSSLELFHAVPCALGPRARRAHGPPAATGRARRAFQRLPATCIEKDDHSARHR